MEHTDRSSQNEFATLYNTIHVLIPSYHLYELADIFFMQLIKNHNIEIKSDKRILSSLPQIVIYATLQQLAWQFKPILPKDTLESNILERLFSFYQSSTRTDKVVL
jgi:hypothetical protein